MSALGASNASDAAAAEKEAAPALGAHLRAKFDWRFTGRRLALFFCFFAFLRALLADALTIVEKNNDWRDFHSLDLSIPSRLVSFSLFIYLVALPTRVVDGDGDGDGGSGGAFAIRTWQSAILRGCRSRALL